MCSNFCNLCSPPAPFPKVSILTDWGEAVRKNHVREFHLGPYEPLKCPKCNETFAIEQLFASHVTSKHNDPSIKPVEDRSEYLEALGKLMMQSNSFPSNNACDMIHAVKEKTTIKDRNQREMSPKFESDDDFKPDPPKIEKRTKKWVSCGFCTERLKNPSTLRVHEDLRHNLVSSAPHRCGKCERRFHCHSLYLAHQRKRSGCDSNSARRKGRRRQKGYHCKECNCEVNSALAHLSRWHIKKPVLRCSKCSFSTRDWALSNLKTHIRLMHKGRASYIDDRPTVLEEIKELRQKLIRRKDGGVMLPYRCHLAFKKRNRTRKIRNEKDTTKKRTTSSRIICHTYLTRSTTSVQ